MECVFALLLKEDKSMGFFCSSLITWYEIIFCILKGTEDNRKQLKMTGFNLATLHKHSFRF